MTHTRTEQPWWREHTDDIERKVASGEMNAATCFTKMLWLVSEASKAQRVPVQCVVPPQINQMLNRRMYATGWADCQRAHGITQEKQG